MGFRFTGKPFAMCGTGTAKSGGVFFGGGKEVALEGLFTTRGDIYFSKLAEGLGAEVNRAGEIVVGMEMRTTVRGVYAAGCVTPANCQMIIAAGQGATAAQAINRNLFEESLAKGSLKRASVRG
jgi:thioredoxin reductase (NADPH)